MTKKEISQLVFKNAIKPMLLAIIAILSLQMLNQHYVGYSEKAPFFAIIFALIVLIYIVRNILIELYATDVKRHSN